MITYYPWCDEVLDECLRAHDSGDLVTLDLELTANCTSASCIYCDSRPKVGSKYTNELTKAETKNLLEEALSCGLKWIYICGLGEPLEDDRFVGLVEEAAIHDVRMSVFTNGILIDAQTATWLHKKAVNLVLKMDTFEEPDFDRILGRKGAAQRIYEATEFLLSSGYGKGYADYTDMAFSIVPTQLNLNGIDKVIEYAKEKNIFPSVGELEQAGRTLRKKTYQDLALDHANIVSLKERVEHLLWKGYTRPICPSIITGLHVDNIGNCVVDAETGLNCKWFLLREPKVEILGNIRQNSVEELLRRARGYRETCFQRNASAIDFCESIEYIFGGCGGSPRKIIQIARDHLGSNSP